MSDSRKKPGYTLVEPGSIKARKVQILHIEHEIQVLRDRKWIIQHEVILMGGKITVIERMKHILEGFR